CGEVGCRTLAFCSGSICWCLKQIPKPSTNRAIPHTSTSNTANCLLLPPTAHVRPSGEKQTHVTFLPRSKSRERMASPVSELNSVSTFLVFNPTNTGNVGLNANNAFVIVVGIFLARHCPEAMLHKATPRDLSLHNASVSPLGEILTSVAGSGSVMGF